MEIDISFFSTSMIGFECIWTGVFTTLQMGTYCYYDCLFAVFGLSLMLLESIAASIFVTLSGPPEFCDAKTPISVCSSITILVPISWLAATLRAYNVLLLRRPAPDTPRASSAGLLCGHIDVMHHAPAFAPRAVVHLHLFHRLVRRRFGRRRNGQAQLLSSSDPPGGRRFYASIRRLPSSFNFFAPSGRGESALGQP